MFIFYKSCRVDVSPYPDSGRVAAHAVLERTPLPDQPGKYMDKHDSGVLGHFDTFDEAARCAISWAYEWIDRHWA